MKTTLILLSCVLIHSACSSQFIRSYGIKAGLVSATQTWETTAPYSYPYPIKEQPGIDVGLFVEWLNMPILSVLTETHYIQKGANVESHLHADYLSVPIMAKARLSGPPFDESPFSLYVIAGPRVDVLLQTRAGGFNIYYDKFEKLDYGATVGAGLEFSYIGPFRVGLEFQYSPNFTDSDSENYTKIRNNSWELLITVGM